MKDDDDKRFVYVPIDPEGARGFLRLYEWVRDQKIPFIPMELHYLAEKIRGAMNQGCMKHHLLEARFKEVDKRLYIVVCQKCDRKIYNQLKSGEFNESQYKMLRDVDEYKELFII